MKQTSKEKTNPCEIFGEDCYDHPECMKSLEDEEELLEIDGEVEG